MTPTASHRILLIEDNVEEAYALSRLIRMHDPSLIVDTAVTAEEGVFIIRKPGYDLIVCDFKLPGITGLSFLELSKEIQPQVPVVLISGYGKEDLEQRALRLGAWAFLSKPLDHRTLSHTIRNALAYRQSDAA